MNDTTYKKKLIEVALPLDIINEASGKEKSIRQGHPSTMHIWWARRTLAACRAILLASIIDDPSNYLPVKEADKERKKIFGLIEKVVQWKQPDKKAVLNKVSDLIGKSTKNNPPPVLDPFSGGGTIPFSAQNIGLDAYGSDLNPVAVMISKGLVEIPPIFSDKGPVNPKSKKLSGYSWSGSKGLAEDVRYYGGQIKQEAMQKIGKLYPQVNNNNILAWIWCRSVKCQNPACQVEIPLVKNLKLDDHCYIHPFYEKNNLKFRLDKKEPIYGSSTKEGRGSYFKCINCGQIATEDYIKHEGNKKKLLPKLMAGIVENKKGHSFIEVRKEDEELALKNRPTWAPTQVISEDTGNLIRARGYGFTEWSEFFLPRQLMALTTFSDLIKNLKEKILDDMKTKDNIPLHKGGRGDYAYAEAICIYLTFAFDRCVNYWSSFTFWGGSFVVQTFSKQTISMVWDFTEVNPFSNSTGNWDGAIEWEAKVLDNIDTKSKGEIKNLDSSKTLDYESIRPLISTDPPYYDNINYAELSDYFYVWMRPLLINIYPDIFSTLLTPKSQELIAAPYRFDGNQELAKKHFLDDMERCFKLMREKINEDYPLTIYYAYKQTEVEELLSEAKSISSTGWETMLVGLIKAGFKIVGTWPVRTERFQGFKTGKNYLASSIVIVCRPRQDDAPISTRREFINALKKEIPSALKNLQEAVIAPVDMAQSAIGPGMAVFSRYSKVIEADGTKMSVRAALQIINQELDSYLNEQEADMDKETRFCVSWYEQYGWNEGPFGDADTLARARGTAVNALESAQVVYAKAGKTRLIKRTELDDNLDLTNDKKLTVWKCVQYLVKVLDEKGETGAADIVRKIGGLSEPVKELTYKLYALCERQGWTEDGIKYNFLILSWQSITDKAQFGERMAEETSKKIKDKSQKKLGSL